MIHLTLPTNCLSVFDHFVGLELKGLTRGVFIILFRTSCLTVWDVYKDTNVSSVGTLPAPHL